MSKIDWIDVVEKFSASDQTKRRVETTSPRAAKLAAYRVRHRPQTRKLGITGVRARGRFVWLSKVD